MSDACMYLEKSLTEPLTITPKKGMIVNGS